MKQFIFGAEGLPKTPQELARLRRIAEALAPSRAPKDVGEGLNAIGNAIVYRSMMNKADKGEASGIESAANAFNSLFSSSSPDAAAPAADPAPQEPIAGTLENSRKFDRESVDGYVAKPKVDVSDVGATESYIRQAAQQRGIDPDIAVKVARAEGLAPGVWQSNVKKNGLREPSYGPFQLLVGDGKNFPKGMGNDFMAKTGLDPRDPSTVQKQIDFALDNAKRTGWRSWYGAKAAGLGAWDGINANQVADASATVPAVQTGVMPSTPATADAAPQKKKSILSALLGGARREQPGQQTQQPVNPQVAQALMGGQDFDMQKAIEVLNNPYINDGQRAAVQMLLKRKMDEQQIIREQQMKQQDPAYQLELETKRLGLDALKNPPKMRNLTDEEEKAMGLDPAGVYQSDPSGKISVLKDAPKSEADWEYKDGVKFNKRTGAIERVPASENAGFRFSGNSVDAQALNGLMDSGKLTPEQAQQIAAGKTITGPNGEIIFMTPQGIFGQNAGQQAQPIVPFQPEDTGIDIFADQPAAQAPAARVPVVTQPAAVQKDNKMIQLTEPKVTLDERKAQTFADRMVKSGALVDKFGQAGLSNKDAFIKDNGWIPDILENQLVGDDYQQLDQARRDFINAQLRRESGAVISTEEFDNANKQYFPQPGDSEATLKQKAENRRTAISGMVRDGGPTYKQPEIQTDEGWTELAPGVRVRKVN